VGVYVQLPLQTEKGRVTLILGCGGIVCTGVTTYCHHLQFTNIQLYGVAGVPAREGPPVGEHPAIHPKG
jgi:hypothetical protein